MNVDEHLALRDSQHAIAWADLCSRFNVEVIPRALLFEFGFMHGVSAGLAMAQAVREGKKQ
jgi:hypothetical protein